MRKCDKRFCMSRDISECKILIQHDTAAVNGKLIANNSRNKFATHGSVELGSSSWLGLYKFVQDHMTTWIVKCIHFHLGSSASNVTQPFHSKHCWRRTVVYGSRQLDFWIKTSKTSSYIWMTSIYVNIFQIILNIFHQKSSDSAESQKRSPLRNHGLTATSWVFWVVDPVACCRMVPYLFEGNQLRSKQLNILW